MKHFYHFSHGDLDGIMCHAITSYVLYNLADQNYFETIEEVNFIEVPNPNNLADTILNVTVDGNELGSLMNIAYRLDKEDELYIIITDLSMNYNVYDYLKDVSKKRNVNLIYVDHHESTYEFEEKEKSKGNWIITDKEFNNPSSASWLYYSYLFGIIPSSVCEIKPFLGSSIENKLDKCHGIGLISKIVSMYDTFRFKKESMFNVTIDTEIGKTELKLPELLNSAFYLEENFASRRRFLLNIVNFVQSLEESKQLANPNMIQVKYDETQVILAKTLFQGELEKDYYKKIKFIKDYFMDNRMRLITFEGYQCGICLGCPNEYFNEVAYQALTTYFKDKIDIVMNINLDKASVGLRSAEDSDVNVAKIAEYYEGGGHAHAAGFPVNLHRKEEFIIGYANAGIIRIH